MGLQICPKCKEKSFTWFIGGKFPVTTWSCFDCDFEAKEVESGNSTCENCGETTKIRLKDKEREYCWCSNCNETSDI
ncbi:hypothetical protein [Chryseobacterium sp. GP-SGM7]|uniref:hypothetical protein n=1 Tax=Chryseobacterium sp. GP-SGM7 TaxID=3411323 RepID=UPI003B936D59